MAGVLYAADAWFVGRSPARPTTVQNPPGFGSRNGTARHHSNNPSNCDGRRKQANEERRGGSARNFDGAASSNLLRKLRVRTAFEKLIGSCGIGEKLKVLVGTTVAAEDGDAVAIEFSRSYPEARIARSFRNDAPVHADRYLSAHLPDTNAESIGAARPPKVMISADSPTLSAYFQPTAPL